MGVRILANADDDMAVLYASVTDTAYGPVFQSKSFDLYGITERLEAFLKTVVAVPQRTDEELRTLFREWMEKAKCPNCLRVLTIPDDAPAYCGDCGEDWLEGESVK